ncbi:glycoside hydrolase superfamily [Xylogone sp. PMI_703]|nr:glycoside hydrolase superfamily [Xylogone sp. PMI_703]
MVDSSTIFSQAFVDKMHAGSVVFGAIAALLVPAIATPAAQLQKNTPLVSSAGSTVPIPGWYIQSSAHVSQDVSALSKPGVDTSSWYRVSSHCTVMAGLLENNVYNDTTLFWSDNLEFMVDASQFSVPWFYREEFTLQPKSGQRYFLETNGVTSKADLYINGVQIASKATLKGAYGGLRFDVTNHVTKGTNAVLIRAYPTDYLADFALGFVDWNPYPPDNGMGVWREVTVSQTGAVSMRKPRVITDYVGKATNRVTATVKVDLKNSGSSTVHGNLQGVIKEEGGLLSFPFSTAYTLKAGENNTVAIQVPISQPKIWWPKQWGAQPLYTLDVSAYTGKDLSDKAQQRTFGIKHVTSAVNSYEDVAFTVNGQPFLVLGAGYTSDMFLRLDETRLAAQFAYMLDQGLNTVRLEGKQEHPSFYDLADRMGLMVLAGWECCDKWEGWTYNDEADGVKWDDDDYDTAGKQMAHEAAMMQGHASMLGFLVGSDFWPDERASPIYVDTLRSLDWDVPIIASAAKRGYPTNLGPSGMKMDGPYDWVSPNYWYGDQLGAAFGFGSELGPGVGTPELSSLKKFLTEADMNDLWTAPDKGLYHMSTNVSSFYDRSIYNSALYARYGAPRSLSDYLLKAQSMDYEATRAEYEAYSVRKNAERPATGAIYWMLNNAWPSLHWNFFDYYLKAAGSYFGAKMGSRPEHVVFEYGSANGSIWLINHTLDKKGARTIEVDLLSKDGKTLFTKHIKTTTTPNYSKLVDAVPEAIAIKDTTFLRLILKDTSGSVLSRNVYWLSVNLDVNDWDNSDWYFTPVTSYANYTTLQTLKSANIDVKPLGSIVPATGGRLSATIRLENKAKVPAHLIRLELEDSQGSDVLPAFWGDNYVTLWPGEKITTTVQWMAASSKGSKVVKISGANVKDGQVVLK